MGRSSYMGALRHWLRAGWSMWPSSGGERTPFNFCLQAVDEGAYLSAAGEWTTAFHTRDVENVAIEHNRSMAVTRWKRETLSCRIPGKKVNKGRLHDAGGRDKWMLRPHIFARLAACILLRERSAGGVVHNDIVYGEGEPMLRLKTEIECVIFFI